ncbi:hypothetical protein HZA99_05765 [Candidatus Woesearchaeota archaeon]|nr:hypothetical protein [Candidatus Woesearchaeota archaeon]
MTDFQILPTERVLLEGILEAIRYIHHGIIFPDSTGNYVQIIGIYPPLSDSTKVEPCWSAERWSFISPETAILDKELQRMYK